MLSTWFPCKLCWMNVPSIFQSFSHGHGGVIASILFCDTRWALFPHSKECNKETNPQGPFLFSLVLQHVVNTVKSDDGCVSLHLHAWYLDDGALAGKSSSVLNALNILQSLGPFLGLFINLKKCELLGCGDLSQFPVSVPYFNVPNMEILGSPISDVVFCSQVVHSL